MTMTRAAGSALGLAAMLGLAALSLLDACRSRPSASAIAPDGGNAGEVPWDDAGRAYALRPARCRPTEDGVVIDEGRAADVEIGDAVATAEGYAVGLVHRTSAGRVAAIASVSRPGSGVDAGSRHSAPRVIDLGPTIGDAPPPRLALRGTNLVAAAYRRSNAGESNQAGGHGGPPRDLVLYGILADGQALPFLTVAQQRDDSLAFDLAFAGLAGLVVWDEATAASRGVVRAVDVRSEPPTSGAPHDVSPPESDAELPRIVPSGPGFLVLWIARRPEPSRGPDAAEPEATGEPRSFGWIELVRVDERGAPLGPVRLLTPRTGHVSAYDVETLADPARTLLVVARDDGEGTDGSGGALLRVRVVSGDTVEPPVEFSTDGLGRGAPTLVDGPSSYLSWVGPQEQARLLPLDGTGAPIAPPSAEDAFDDARPLRVLEGTQGGGDPVELLVATPSGQPFKLRDFRCTRASTRER
jgi:hypothetical protein